MQASENQILGAVKKGAQWVGDHVFVGAEGEKNPGQKPSFGFGLGLKTGNGEPSTGEDDKEQRAKFISAQHSQFTEPLNKERESAEPTKPVQKSVAQLEAEWTEAKIADWKRRRDAARLSGKTGHEP